MDNREKFNYIFEHTAIINRPKKNKPTSQHNNQTSPIYSEKNRSNKARSEKQTKSVTFIRPTVAIALGLIVLILSAAFLISSWQQEKAITARVSPTNTKHQIATPNTKTTETVVATRPTIQQEKKLPPTIERSEEKRKTAFKELVEFHPDSQVSLNLPHFFSKKLAYYKFESNVPANCQVGMGNLDNTNAPYLSFDRNAIFDQKIPLENKQTDLLRCSIELEALVNLSTKSSQ